MDSSNTTTRTSRRALLAVFLTASCSFIGATVSTELASREISTIARAIADDAVPSVEALAEARYSLKRVGASVRRASGGPPAIVDRAELPAARSRVEQAFARYLALPMYNEVEGEMATDAKERLRLVWRATDEALASQAGRPVAGAHARSLVDDLENADRALDRLIEFNTAYARGYAREVDRLHRRSRLIAIALDVLSVGLTVVAALLAWRALRVRTRRDAERAVELEQFAGRVAHDLRNPIATIGLSLSMVEETTAAEPRARKAVERMQRSVARSAQIIDGLLAFARAGARPEPSARADLDEVIGGALDEAGGAAKDVEIALAADGERGLVAACDPGLLASAVANLVQNAIKYMGDSKERRVTVRTSRIGSCVRVEVEDTGPGLPAGLGVSVFEPFVRAPGSAQPGIGLGLATVKRVVETHGGRVGVISVERGARFWFELPLAQ